jgi:hypothetical protein
MQLKILNIKECQDMIPKIHLRKEKKFLTWGAVQRED